MEAEKVLEKQNSCKICVNAKGQWSGEIKVYAETIEEAKLSAIKQANELSVLIASKNTQ